MSEYIDKNSIKTTVYRAVKEEFGFIWYANRTHISKYDLEKLKENPDKYITSVDEETGRVSLALAPKAADFNTTT